MSLSNLGRVLIPALLFLVQHAAGQAYDYGFDLSKLASRQATSSPFVVKGLPPVKGNIPLRQEIRQLQKSPEKWTLYILGLSMMQYMDQSDQLSWYQIAGPWFLDALLWSIVEWQVNMEELEPDCKSI